MTINKTEQALKSIAIHFSVTKVLDWDNAVSQAMDLLNTNTRSHAVVALGRIIKDLHS